MNNKRKQLNWLIAVIAICAIVGSCVEIVQEGTVRPPHVVTDGQLPATSTMVERLLDMSYDCDIDDEVLAFTDNSILTRDEAITLGDLCVDRAEEEYLDDILQQLGIQREDYEYEKNGGLPI